MHTTRLDWARSATLPSDASLCARRAQAGERATRVVVTDPRGKRMRSSRRDAFGGASGAGRCREPTLRHPARTLPVVEESRDTLNGVPLRCTARRVKSYALPPRVLDNGSGRRADPCVGSGGYSWQTTLSERHSLYLGYVTNTYARVYDEPLESVIVDAYARGFADLYDGSKDMSEVAATLPSDPREMFQPEFLKAFAAGEETWLARALTMNDLFDWTPQAPVRFYYGARDQDSPPADTQFTVDHMRSRGADVSAVKVGDVDHDEVPLIAVPHIRSWFDRIAAQGAHAEAPPQSK